MRLGASFLDTRDIFHGAAYHSGFAGFAVVPSSASRQVVPLANHWLHVGIALTVHVR